MAIAVPLADPYPQNLGSASPVEIIYEARPYGLVQRIRHERADVFWVYTTEHTDADFLNEAWAYLPRGLAYCGQEMCRKVPSDFEDDAVRCTISYYSTHRWGLLVGINKAQFFTTQGVRLM